MSKGLQGRSRGSSFPRCLPDMLGEPFQGPAHLHTVSKDQVWPVHLAQVNFSLCKAEFSLKGDVEVTIMSFLAAQSSHTHPYFQYITIGFVLLCYHSLEIVSQL